MLELAALTVLVLFVLLAWGAIALGRVLLRAVLWLALLPVRLLFYVLLRPLFFIVRAVLGGVFRLTRAAPATSRA